MRWAAITKTTIVLGSLCAWAAGCGDDQVGKVDPVLNVSPDHLDFGTAELGQDVVKPISLKNLQIVKATVKSIVLSSDCGDCFLVLDNPTTVGPNSEVSVGIRFRAVRLKAATGTITVSSDDPKAPVHKVTLIGRGTDTRQPDIAVTPERVDFGFAPAGGVAVGSFSIRSTGTNPLELDRIRIEPPDAPYKITTASVSPSSPGHLPPGASGSVTLRVSLPASATGTVSAQVIIESNVVKLKNVPDHPGWVSVPLTAHANLPPLAIVGPDQTVEPWSRANLDGRMSHDQDNPPDNPLVFRWEMTNKPGGSTTVLERATTAQPSFWVDLTGRYELQLTVTDALGLESEAAHTVVEALPTNAVRIELIWDHPDSDLDLHLLKMGGTFCSCDSDCHYRDCGRHPNWFPGTPGANPSLDIDDRSGFGPENINMNGDGPMRTLVDGDYTILVHYYSSNAGISTWPTQTSNATVRVYVFGLLAAELTKALEHDGDLWTAGTLHLPARTVTPGGSILASQVCANF